MIKFKAFLAYMVKYIFPFILGAIAIIAFNREQLKIVVSEELKPINGYLVTDFHYELEKQIYKIENDPEDLKFSDLEKILVQYQYFSDGMKTTGFDEKVTYIREVYQGKLRGIK